MPALKPHDLFRRMEADPHVLVVDVRDADAYARGTIPGAVHVAYDRGVAAVIAREVHDRRRPIVLVCAWGHRSAMARIAVAREGFRDVSYLDGGLEAWGIAGLAVERGSMRRPLAESTDQRARAAGADL